MSEVIDDKVDKFHEALMRRRSRRTLVASIIFVILFISWQLIREIEIVNGNKIKYYDENEYGISLEFYRELSP